MKRDLPIPKRKRLIKVYAKTNPHYGKKPEERSVRELLDLGMINLDKPSGPTSHQVVSWVKDVLEVEKAGHAGTLDPRVTGVLPIAIGSATKALKVLIEADEKTRVERIIKREGGDFEEKRREMLEREKSEARRYKNYYGIDVGDKSIY
ncbi:MAG TPA: hypothetical protein ENF43_02990, partial [Thermoplasmatales archaeon]|nr:hypothetical protein [Thermoplasmatales archaeon]